MPDPVKKPKYTGPERRVNKATYAGPERRIPVPVRSVYRVSWEVNGSVQSMYVVAYSQADAVDHLALSGPLTVANVASPVEIYGVDEARPKPKPVVVKAKYTGIERRKPVTALTPKYTGVERRAA